MSNEVAVNLCFGITLQQVGLFLPTMYLLCGVCVCVCVCMYFGVVGVVGVGWVVGLVWVWVSKAVAV